MSTLCRVIGGEITLRRAESVADYRACQEAQRLAWGITEDGYVIPVATMVGANLHGGLVLGAFLADGRAVAMSFAFMGRIDGRICLYSQLTGVVPDRQSLGLGYEMKQFQREFAVSENIPLIAWAFDPLQAGNARFNLTKLGAKVRRYVDNMYGLRSDVLNAGVPTDRLIAEWEVCGDSRPASATRHDLTTLPALIDTSLDTLDCLGPQVVAAPPGAPLVWIAVPADVAALRCENPMLAEAWRKAVREAFRASFTLGYEVVDFIRDDSSGVVRCGYLLQRSVASCGTVESLPL